MNSYSTVLELSCLLPFMIIVYFLASPILSSLYAPVYLWHGVWQRTLRWTEPRKWTSGYHKYQFNISPGSGKESRWTPRESLISLTAKPRCVRSEGARLDLRTPHSRQALLKGEGSSYRCATLYLVFSTLFCCDSQPSRPSLWRYESQVELSQGETSLDLCFSFYFFSCCSLGSRHQWKESWNWRQPLVGPPGSITSVA